MPGRSSNVAGLSAARAPAAVVLGAVLGALFGFIPGGPAAAQPAERAAVLVYAGAPAPPGARGAAAGEPRGPSAEQLQQVAQELRRSLAERKYLVVEGAIEQGLRAHGDQRTQPLLMKAGEVRELLRAGQRRLSEVELEQAAAAFEEAERRCGDLLPLKEGPALLSEVLRWRGVAAFELRRRGEAQELFRRALVLSPGAVLTEADVRPDVAQALRRAAAALPPAAPAQIAPQLGEGALRAPAALLAAASVTIDGVEVPMVASRGLAEAQLVPGEHVVMVRAPGFLPEALRAELPRAGPLRVVLRPDRTEAALGSLRRAPSAAGLAALCEALSLRLVLVGAAARDGGQDVIAAERFRCGGPAPGPAPLPAPPELVRLPPGAPGAQQRGGVTALRQGAEQLAQRLLREPGPEAQRPPGPGAPEAPREPQVLALGPIARPRPAPQRRVPIYARPWLWIGAAVVVSGVLLGVALRPQPPAQTTLVVDPHGFALRF